jgi:hypothetical protein
MTTVPAPTAVKTNGRGQYMQADTGVPEVRGVGWLGFAAMMLTIGGIWAIFEGILAISSSKIYTASATYVFSDLHTWGWIVLGLGVLTLFAAAGVVSGSQFGRWYGITIAGLNMFGQLMFLHSNPWWSVTMIVVDICVIYALAVYGGLRLTND